MVKDDRARYAFIERKTGRVAFSVMQPDKYMRGE